MKEVTIEEMHQLLVQIIKSIHEYCEANGIRYSLGGGTLLGAIRHKGFIPWDDDADIMMPRPDYERFLDGFPDKYPHYVLQHWRNTKDYPWYFAKVYDDRTLLKSGSFVGGIYVDVFPLDGLPPIKEQKKYWRKYLIRYLLSNIRKTPFNKLSLKLKSFAIITFPIWALVSERKLREICESFLLKYDFETSECTGCAIGGYGIAEYMGRDTFKQYLDIEFEGHTFKGIADYDEYLTLHYGNYMQLPPIEKRKSHHHFHCWWKDNLEQQT